MRLAAACLVALSLAPPLAGCLDGPTRSSGFETSCPLWVNGLGGQQVTTLFSVGDASDNQKVDFFAGNATRPAQPLTANSPRHDHGGRILTQDRLELDFTSVSRQDGTWLFRGVEVHDGELQLRFTHASDGRPLSGYDTTDRTVTPREVFVFRETRSNFTIQVPLDKGSQPDPAGAFATWTLLRDRDGDPKTPTMVAYAYELRGLFDTCEGRP